MTGSTELYLRELIESVFGDLFLEMDERDLDQCLANLEDAYGDDLENLASERGNDVLEKDILKRLEVYVEKFEEELSKRYDEAFSEIEVDYD